MRYHPPWLLVALGLASLPASLPAQTEATASEADTAPAPEAAASAPVLVPPTLVTFVPATYPPRALEERLEASVVLAIDIDPTGAVEAVAVLEPADPPGYGFDEAAMTAATRFVFTSALAGDEAVPVQISYRYNFTLAPQPDAPATTEQTVDAPQPVVNFRGRLYERGTRRPMAGVIVTVFRGEGDGTEGFEATADAEGRFELFDLAPGTWSILAEPEGFYRLETAEEVVAGERTEATYFLERGSYNPFDVLVTAPRPRKEVSRTSLEVAEADRVPGTFGDVLNVVQNLPGVARTGLGNNGALIVRGSAPEDSQVFIDGVSVPLLYHFGGLRSVIPVGMLERLDFYPGNFSAEYGRATGGILDVGIKRLQPDATHGYVDINLFDAGFFIETPVTETFSLAVSARRSYIDFVLDAAIPDDASVRLVSAPRYYDYQLLANWRPAPAHELRAFFLGSDDQVRLLFSNPGAAGTQLGSSDVRGGTTFYRTLLEYRYVPNESFENVLRASAGRNWIDFGAGDAFVFDLNFYVAQIRDTARWQMTDQLKLNAGVDYLFNTTDARIRLPLAAKEGERRDRPDLSNIFYSETEGKADHSLGLFVEGELRLIPRLLLVPGLRFDHFTRTGSTSVAPRLGARLDLSERWVAKAGVGLFHQEPFFDETDPVFGNPELGLESAVHYSVGAEYRPLEQLTVDATVFYKDLRDLVSRADGVVERNGEAVPKRYDNGGEGRVYGAELLVRHEFAHNFFGWVSYTLSRAQRRDSGAKDWRPFDFDQTHILAAVGTYRLPDNWELGLRWRYVTGALDTPVIGGTFDADADIYEPITGPSNSVRVAPFHQLDLRVDKRWIFDTWTLSAYLDIQNTYNRNNQEGLGYNYDYTESTAEGGGLPILPIVGVRGEF